MKDQFFGAWRVYISFEKCYEVDSEQLFSPSINKYIYQCCYAGVILCVSFQNVVSSCKCNYVFFSKKPFFSSFNTSFTSFVDNIIIIVAVYQPQL